MRRRYIFISVALLACATVGIIALSSTYKSPSDNQMNLAPTSTIETLTHKNASNLDTSHLEDGLIPPTNKWFSGLALQKEPKAVFPTPLSFLAKDASFEIGFPKVATTQKTIFGSHVADIAIEVDDATTYKVTRYDEITVDLTYYNKGSPIGILTLTAGSPLIFFTATQATSLTVPVTQKTNTSKRHASFTSGSTATHLEVFEGGSVRLRHSQLKAILPAGSFITFYELPKGSPNILSQIAGNRITGSRVKYSKKDDNYHTSISLITKNKEPTAFGFLPHHIGNSLGKLKYDTIYGPVHVTTDTSFSFTTPRIPVKQSLDLHNLSKTNRQLLVTTLRHDINATTFSAEDTYFGGKSLYRAAQLLELAHELGEKQIATSIQQKLSRELSTWLTASPREKKSFYYDTKILGIVGQEPAFGSEEFNDHHFHYGYFIYAAGILAKYDHDFLTQHQDIVNLLVADIANYKHTKKLPLRRVFDPYFGHSWASGSSPFNDGNNQESSSESINAWVAISLWATQIKNTDLQLQADWMLSNEVASTSAYWMNYDTQQLPYIEYKPSIVSLNWGGKRDYGTFFSAEPSAMLGILLIPLNPTSVYMAMYGDRIKDHVDEALPLMDIDAQFSDYILMYSALGGATDQLEVAKRIPEETIDGANSRSYLYAWIISQQEYVKNTK